MRQREKGRNYESWQFIAHCVHVSECVVHHVMRLSYMYVVIIITVFSCGHRPQQGKHRGFGGRVDIDLEHQRQ